MTFTLVSQKRTLSQTSLDAEIEWRISQLRRSGAGRGSLVKTVGAIDEETVLRILAIHQMDARVLLVHPKWTLAETERSVREVENAPTRESKKGEARTDFILFTSGTEGAPKAVELSGHGFALHARASAKRLGLSKNDRWLLTLTPAHVGGLALILRARVLGSTLIIPPSRSSANLTPQIEKHGVTHLSLVPTQLVSWMDAVGGKPPKGLKLVLLGGAPCPPELERRAKDAGWPIRTTYGLTEASSQVATQSSSSPLGSVGTALEGVEVKVDAADGKPGAILVKGPTLMLGYVGARAPFTADGWFRTPDLGRLDPQGNMWVVGRRDDVIVTGGENVDPGELEALLETHPKVAQACVIGVPDAKWGQSVVAVVVSKSSRPTPEELSLHLKESVASFKLPRTVVFWDDLPRTPGGKLQRARVRERFVPSTVPT